MSLVTLESALDIYSYADLYEHPLVSTPLAINRPKKEIQIARLDFEVLQCWAWYLHSNFWLAAWKMRAAREIRLILFLSYWTITQAYACA